MAMRDPFLRHAGVLSSPPAPVADRPEPRPTLALPALMGALERLLDLNGADPAHRRLAERLLTDAAAAVLDLERARLSAKRRRTAALLDASVRPEALAEAESLAADEREAKERIVALRSLMARVRSRLTRHLAV